MKLKETIIKKRAMLSVVESVVNDIESSLEYAKTNRDQAVTDLDKYLETTTDEKDGYSYKAQIGYYNEEIARCEAQVDAYETVIKTLEKLI